MRLSDILFTIIILLIISFSIYLFISNYFIKPVEKVVEKNALIVDTVRDIHLNNTLIRKIGNILIKSGYNVTTCLSENFTVNFVKKLYKYDLIILRVHSTVTNTPLQFLGNGSVAIITGEIYRKDRYTWDQLNERLLPSSLLPQTGIVYGYFAFTRLFILNYIPKFRNATIIVMGCHSLYSSDMAEACISKGAKIYIGWNGYVTPEHMDKALYRLIYYLYVRKECVGKAVMEVMMEIGRDPEYGAELKFYPIQAYDYKPSGG